MFQMKFHNVGQVKFFTLTSMTTEEAKEYALKELKESGAYVGCTIGKVYVNDELVMENVKL